MVSLYNWLTPPSSSWTLQSFCIVHPISLLIKNTNLKIYAATQANCCPHRKTISIMQVLNTIASIAKGSGFSKLLREIPLPPPFYLHTCFNYLSDKWRQSEPIKGYFKSSVKRVLKYKSLFSVPEIYGKLEVHRKKIRNQQILSDCCIHISQIRYVKIQKIRKVHLWLQSMGIPYYI